MAIEDEIQRLVTEACQKVVEEQEVKFKELQDKFQEVLDGYNTQKAESKDLKDEIASNKSATDTLVYEIRQELQTATSELKERLERLQDDPDGEGGIKQLRAEVTTFSEEITKYRNEMEDHGRKTKSCKSDTDDMRIKMAECMKKCEDTTNAGNSAEVRLKEIEDKCEQVQERQKVVEDSVAGKYSELWKDVLHALDKMKNEMLELVQEDTGTKFDIQSQVKYVSKLISSVHNDRRKLAVTKQFLTFWQHYTWTEVHRKIGLNIIAGFFRRRTHQVLHRWVHHTSIENLKADLRTEYSKMIPDLPKEIEASGLPDKCSQLEGELETSRKDLGEMKLSVEDYGTRIDRSEARANAEDSRAEELSLRLQEVAEELQAFKPQTHETMSQLGARIEDTQLWNKKLEEDQRNLAKMEEVKEVQADIARFWLCIKTLDTAKANKTDVDSFALETRNMHKQSSRHIQDLEEKVSDKVQEETIRMQEKCSELDGKVDERAKQLEQMSAHMDNQWQRLAALVEKLANEQQMLSTQAAPRTTRNSRPASAQRLPRNGSERTLDVSSNIPVATVNALSPIDSSLRERERLEPSVNGILGPKSRVEVVTQPGLPRRMHDSR